MFFACRSNLKIHWTTFPTCFQIACSTEEFVCPSLRPGGTLGTLCFPPRPDACTLVCAPVLFPQLADGRPSTGPPLCKHWAAPRRGPPWSSSVFPSWLACGSQCADACADDPGVLLPHYKDVALLLMTSTAKWIWFTSSRWPLARNSGYFISGSGLVQLADSLPDFFFFNCGWNVNMLLFSICINN